MNEKWQYRDIQCGSCGEAVTIAFRDGAEVKQCGQDGMNISLESQGQFHYGLTASVTKSVRLSLAATVESEPQDTTEAQQVWRAVAHALGELQMWLLAPATPIVFPSTQN